QEESVLVFEQPADALEKPLSLRRVEIADRAPEKQHQAPSLSRWDVDQIPLEVAGDGMDLEAWIVIDELGRDPRGGQSVHVERHVADVPAVPVQGAKHPPRSG